MKKILLLISTLLLSFSFVSASESVRLTDLTAGGTATNRLSDACKSAWSGASSNCWLDSWINNVKWGIKNIVKDRTFSEYAQDIVAYILKFTYVISVIYIIYAGFLILMSAWSDEKMWAAKNNIVYVMVWIIVIYLANSIVAWTINLVQ